MLVCSAAASATPVLQLDGHHVRLLHDRFLPAVTDARPPARTPRGIGPESHSRRASAARSGPTVLDALRGLRAQRRISFADYARYYRSYRDALRARAAMGGTRRSEMSAVISILGTIAHKRELTVSRLPALFLILDRNREWWNEGPLLSSGERVTFKGSRLIFQYYPGEGIQLQMLGNFGRVNGLFQGDGKHRYQLSAALMLDELIPLAAIRGGAPAWEYYFYFDGGSPPWVSGLAQGAAVQALARVGTYFHDKTYLSYAERGLRIFELPPPLGVRQRRRHGIHYLIYSFAPGMHVLNAFTYALVSLYDVGKLTGSARAQRLFRQADPELRYEVPRHDTGSWSLYDEYTKSDLSYHVLLRDFLRDLCDRTHTRIYCVTAERFTDYLDGTPVLTLYTRSARRGRRVSIDFKVSTASHVSVRVLRGSRSFLSRGARLTEGRHLVRWRAPRRAGRYTVTLSARGPSGRHGSLRRTIVVR